MTDQDSIFDEPTGFGGELHPGAVFADRYEILKVLGRGGMGVVYGARDGRLGREVAIKIIPSLLAKDRRAVRALEKEALAGIDLAHENIARVFHWDEWRGSPYLVTEWVRGRTLLEILGERGSVSEEETKTLPSKSTGSATFGDPFFVHS